MYTCTVLFCILQIVFNVCACTEMTETAGTARRPHSDAGPWGGSSSGSHSGRPPRSNCSDW